MSNFYKNLLLCNIFVTLSVCLYLLWWMNTSISDNSLDSSTTFRNCSKLIVHIETNQFHWREKPGNETITRSLSKFCPGVVGECITTTDTTQFNSATAIIFNGVFMNNKEQIVEFMKSRSTNQIWIYFQSEAPTFMTDKEIDVLKFVSQDVFNWTATYRRDSDIYMPYGRLVFNATTNNSRNNKARYASNEFLTTFSKIPTSRKKKLICWIVSNCHSKNERELLASSFSNHNITVDIYGDCGSHHCSISRSGAALPAARQTCRSELSSQYKFYLAFENSLCQDYITEKFFGTLIETDMVPIVYGLNYSSIPNLPPNSYINALDYNSVEELSNYLKWLDANPAEYLKYLQAKHGLNHIPIEFEDHDWECELCNKLWNGYRTSINAQQDLYAWWTHSTETANYATSSVKASAESACYSPNDWPIMQKLASSKVTNR